MSSQSDDGYAHRTSEKSNYGQALSTDDANGSLSGRKSTGSHSIYWYLLKDPRLENPSPSTDQSNPYLLKSIY